MSVNSIENELVILTKQTIDMFLKAEHPADVIALYTFYYYTAKWQKTNQPKCTTGYVSNGLNLSEERVRKAKKELIKLGLVDDVQVKDDTGKIIGHYIKLNYIFKECNHPKDFPEGGEIHRVEKEETNALSANSVNALSVDIENIIAYLNEKANKHYKSNNRDSVKHIKARLKEGYSASDFYIVIDKKCREWKGTEFEQYLRPATLFGTKFESYLNAPERKNNANKTSKDGSGPYNAEEVPEGWYSMFPEWNGE